MTALRERLGQLGTRIAPGAGGFWSWWVSSLQSWLPARWRLLLGVSGARVLLSPQGGQVHVLQAQGAEALLQQSLQAPLLPEALQAALSPRDARLPRCALLPAGKALRKPMRLPAAADGRLHDVLRFEIDRQTPFTAEQVYFDVRLLGRQADGQLDVELVVAPRTVVETLLLPREAWQGQLDGVDVADAQGQPLGVNLLPAALRRQRQDPMRRLNRMLVLGSAVLLVLAGWQLLDNRRQAAATLAAQVEAASVRARAVATQRQQLQDLVDGQAFFAQQRAAQPTATEVINELSQRLDDDTSLEKLSIEAGRMQLIGMSRSSSSLVSRLEGSSLWKTPSLTGVLQAGGGDRRERFTLTAELLAPRKEAADGAATRTP